MKLLIFILPFLFLSCGHHRDVRPGIKGIHRVVVTSESTELGQRDSINQANHYCEQFEKSAAFEKEQSKYIGSVDENFYKRTKMVTRAAKTGGSGAWVHGGKKGRNASGIVGLGGSTLDSALGNGYSTEMTFRCI